jgi:ATP-binding cassette, subfamily A (ABC1), member 2
LYNKRNWKSLLTQIILPALFICIAMTVALSAPGFLDLPPLELTPAQFYPLTKPEGIYVPYSYASNKSDTNVSDTKRNDAEPASSLEIIETLELLIGVGSTCVLNKENLTLKEIFLPERNNLFNETYFGKTDSCRIVFNQNADINYDYFKYQNASSTKTKAKTPFLRDKNKKLEKYYPNCECLADFSGFRCTNSFETPNSFLPITHESLLNISGQNESEYYLYTTDMYRLKRYGGLSFDNERPMTNSQTNEKDQNENNMKNFELIQNLIKYRNARIWYNNKGKSYLK